LKCGAHCRYVGCSVLLMFKTGQDSATVVVLLNSLIRPSTKSLGALRNMRSVLFWYTSQRRVLFLDSWIQDIYCPETSVGMELSLQGA